MFKWDEKIIINKNMTKIVVVLLLTKTTGDCKADRMLLRNHPWYFDEWTSLENSKYAFLNCKTNFGCLYESTKLNSDPSISLDFVRCTQPVKISRQLVHFLLPVEYLLLPQHINSMILNENYTSLDPCCLPVWLPCL